MHATHTHWEDQPILLAPGGQRAGYCGCCGQENRVAWGDLHCGGAVLACYAMHWTAGSFLHSPDLDLLIQRPQPGGGAVQVLVAWRYSAARGQVAIIDAASRPAGQLCRQAMSRQQVWSDPWLHRLSETLRDAVWAGDARLAEVVAAIRAGSERAA